MNQQTTAGAEQQHAPAETLAWTPAYNELCHLELLLTGAYPPLTGFMSTDDVTSVESYGTLADGTPWPVPVTLSVPERLADVGRLTLQDPEGAPLADLHVRERWQRDGVWHLAGPVERMEDPQYGAFRRLRRTPAEVTAELGDRPVLAVVTDRPLLRPDVLGINRAAELLGARVLVLPLLTVSRADSLVRAVLTVREELPDDVMVVPIPLPSSAEDYPQAAERLRAHVAAAYGATHLLSPVETIDEEPIPRVAAPILPGDISHVNGLLDADEPIPGHLASPALVRELRRARPPLHERGLTVFFTGLSGSGKSTIARGLYDALLERGDRSVTLLDGDVVRRMLSAGLTFSKADRDLNIRRIGYVAAEVSRHGGLAICAPIAPYAATRAEVRRMVEEVGDFALIHVATPLKECERRDRKGLYAKARAGEIKEFTGISDPYEEPDDAELVLDTTDMSHDEAVDRVLDLLIGRGWLRSQ